MQYSDATLIVPPMLVPALRCFDGEQTDLELRQALTEATGDLRVSEIATHLSDVLGQAGFFENERFEEMRHRKQLEFAESPHRLPAHAGSAYPEETDELRSLMEQYMEGGSPAADGLCGIAAPHVSPEGGWRCYRDAYASLPRQMADRTFVVLGTSHYGPPERFGLTRKRFETPFGRTEPALDLVDRLERDGGPSVLMEDYCHAVEHSIEFQVVFLQSLFGPDIRVLPILCGSYARSIYEGGMPEDTESVRRFLGALSELQAREGDRLCWVLGIDMAHIGRRYQDPFAAKAQEGVMQEVAERDRRRLDAICAGQLEEYWALVQEGQDDLRWCGNAPLYTFMHAVPGVQGTLASYEQWNIDEQSVVSFAALGFRKP